MLLQVALDKMQAGRRPQIAPLLQVPINQLFIPRPQLIFWEPNDRPVTQRSGVSLLPTSNYLKYMDKPEEESGEILEVPTVETPSDRKARKAKEKLAQVNIFVEKQLASWNPTHDPKIDPTSDPYKSLIVGKLSYETTEKKLCLEFERYGPIRTARIVRDIKTGKSKGYAFVEYERGKDMRCALRDANGMKIDGRRIFVDVERGRTQKEWKPRRFGGGLGTTRDAKAKRIEPV